LNATLSLEMHNLPLATVPLHHSAKDFAAVASPTHPRRYLIAPPHTLAVALMVVGNGLLVLDCCGLNGTGAAITGPPVPALLDLRSSLGGLGSGYGIRACCPLSSYAGRSSRCTLFMLMPPTPLPSSTAPLSRATSTACRNRSLRRSNMLEKSNAPPSLNSMTISSSACCGGMPPPDTGCMMASHLLAPNQGAVTRESATLRMGTAKDCRVGVGATGRYISCVSG
jgi:hypothetical protein